MSKASVINYFRYFPIKSKGFTVQEVARFNRVSSISVYITVRELKRHDFVRAMHTSHGKGRGKGKTKAMYYFTHNGLIWLRRNGVMV
jgi:DNA-binding PadR family transcriptional regulator